MMGPAFSSLLLGVVWLIFVLGGLLAWIGWRGRRVNDHPICRKCGFDLVGHAARISARGVDAATGAPTGRCPECGTNLDSPKAIRVGQRVRRTRMMLIGLVLLLIGGLGVGGSTVAMFSSTNWNSHKPTWLLVFEAERPSRSGAKGVYAELLARQGANPAEFAGTRAGRLVAAILNIQGDPAALWHPEMGQLLEALRNGGLVDDAQWSIYAHQAMDPVKVDVSDGIEEGDPLVVRASFVCGRAGPSGVLVLHDRLVSVTVGSAVQLGGGGSSRSLGGGGTSTTQSEHSFDLVPGRYEAVIKMTRSVFDGGWKRTNTVVKDQPVEYRVPFTVVAKGSGVRSLQADPGKLDPIEAAVTLQGVKIIPGTAGTASRLELTINVKGAPVDLAMDLLLEIPASDDKPARLHRVLGFTARGGSGQYSTGGGADLPNDFPAGALSGEKTTLKFVMRGSMKTLKSTVDMQHAWDGSFSRSVEADIRRENP